MKKIFLIISLIALLSVGLGIKERETALERQQDDPEDILAGWPQTEVLFVTPDKTQIVIMSYREMGIEAEITADEKLKIDLDEEKLAQRLKDSAEFPCREGRNSYFSVSYDNVLTIVPEEQGQVLDTDIMIDTLKQNLRPYGPVAVEIAYREFAPERTREDLEKLDIHELLGEYQTYFAAEDRARTANIWLAQDNFREYILLPGETLSFNETVGERTPQRGYQKAGVLVNAKHETGYGGGVCQVSSTLYNAALKADLTIIERHAHSHAVNYVPLGCDAAVVYGEKDLKIRNDRDDAVLIVSCFAADSLSIKIFG